jgi:catechol 2,3-dioxygenase-like lactoylglutathione lyase family enzyme
MLQDKPSTIATPLLVPTTTRLGPVHIAVTDPDRALTIWRDVVGLTLLSNDGSSLVLGAGSNPLIVLYPGARTPVTANTLGLYHVAIHVPTRRDLARALNRAAHARIRVSPTDHLVSEALYLWDLDGNGIEITYETPWRGKFVENDELMAMTPDGKPHSGREPIDVDGLIAELDGDDTPLGPMPEGTQLQWLGRGGEQLDAVLHVPPVQIRVQLRRARLRLDLVERPPRRQRPRDPGDVRRGRLASGESMRRQLKAQSQQARGKRWRGAQAIQWMRCTSWGRSQTLRLTDGSGRCSAGPAGSRSLPVAAPVRGAHQVC